MASLFTLPGGAQLGYVILGEKHLKDGVVPLVIINGMSMRFEDWDVISKPLSEKRTVLLFDHRYIGASILTSSQHKHEELTIALMASDAVALVQSLGWKTVNLLGYSMGGSIVQQILVTPSLPFTVPHAILAATTTKAPHGDPEFIDLMLNPRAKPAGPVTAEQRRQQALDYSRRFTELGYDPEWLSVPGNRELLEAKLPNQIVGRPGPVVAAQSEAVRLADHRRSLHLVPRSTMVLVLHGKRDRIILYGESEYILRGIKHARRVSTGKTRGSLPSDEYGHTWYDYFTPDVWVDTFEAFLNDVEEGLPVAAKL